MAVSPDFLKPENKKRIKGEKLMLEFFHKLPQIESVRGRHDIIVELCKGKRVLHVGCVDAGLLETRLDCDQLLHTKIEAVAKSQLGVDVDEDGIRLLKSRGYQNIILLDLTKDYLPESYIPETGFDIIILSEVIEHLSNPGLMLDALHRLCSARTELIVSTPNPYSVDVLWEIAFGIEKVHPDHCAWYTLYTIENLVLRHGFVVKKRLAYCFVTEDDFLFFPKRVNGLLGSPSQRVKKPVTSLKLHFWSIQNEHKREGRSYLQIMLRRFLNTLLYSRGPYFSNGFMLIVKKVEHS